MLLHNCSNNLLAKININLHITKFLGEFLVLPQKEMSPFVKDSYDRWGQFQL